MKTNLGRERDSNDCCMAAPTKPGEGEKTIFYPEYHVGSQYGPEADDPIDLGELKGGQELAATVRVKEVTRIEKADGKIRYAYDFEVVSMDIPGGKQEKDGESRTSSKKENEEAIDKGLDEVTKEKDEE